MNFAIGRLFTVRSGSFTTLLKCVLSSRTFDLPFTSDSPVESPSAAKFEIPLITERKLDKSPFCSGSRSARQAWLETLKPLPTSSPTASEGESFPLSPVGIVDLHPDVFAVFPRLDLVHKNLYWQAHYRMVDWRCITTRAELPYRSNRKPWPQKGTGRARHGNRRTHIWVGGGQCKGPRGPESYFSILPRDVRLAGLLSMLTIKHAQDDLHIVDDMALSDSLEQQAKDILHETLQPIVNDLDQMDPLSAANRTRVYRFTKAMNNAAIYLRQLVDARRWGPSVLFVTESNSPFDALTSSLSVGNSNLSNPEDTINWDDLPNLAIHLACSAYANHVEAEQSPETSMYSFEAVAPRATHPGRGLTLMPLHGLNVWSMVHHDTLVISLACLEQLESRLLTAQRCLVRDEALEPPNFHPTLSEALALSEQPESLENDTEGLDQSSRRHFSDRLESVYAKRVKLS
ncbi:39S ribosomal protein L4 mitochondrial [Paragonimus heterotremus]|uniref:Large ribosomal subunit protein uL4m n=1 Tax=Paragonimus heterotremus TaxID=100268 RepID=A0A8J4TE22_9TREM|nr:39S ribosomal protein L4 mitochondrial [Paragonimus heterotremus]